MLLSKPKCKFLPKSFKPQKLKANAQINSVKSITINRKKTELLWDSNSTRQLFNWYDKRNNQLLLNKNYFTKRRKEKDLTFKRCRKPIYTNESFLVALTSFLCCSKLFSMLSVSWLKWKSIVYWVPPAKGHLGSAPKPFQHLSCNLQKSCRLCYCHPVKPLVC